MSCSGGLRPLLESSALTERRYKLMSTVPQAIPLNPPLRAATGKPARKNSDRLPTNWLWLTRVFAGHAERLVRRNFHSVRLLGTHDLTSIHGRPLWKIFLLLPIASMDLPTNSVSPFALSSFTTLGVSLTCV